MYSLIRKLICPTAISAIRIRIWLLPKHEKKTFTHCCIYVCLTTFIFLALDSNIINHFYKNRLHQARKECMCAKYLALFEFHKPHSRVES